MSAVSSRHNPLWVREKRRLTFQTRIRFEQLAHPSPLTPHPPPLTPHPSPLTPYPSPLTPHPSPPTPHPRNRPAAIRKQHMVEPCRGHTVQCCMRSMPPFYSTHCNTAQVWSWCTQCSSSVVNRYPAVYIILCIGEKNGKIKIVSGQLFCNKIFALLSLSICMIPQYSAVQPGL